MENCINNDVCQKYCEKDYDVLSSFFIFLGVFEFGLFFSLIIVSQFVNSKWIEIFKNEENALLDIKIPYEDTYPITEIKFKEVDSIHTNAYVHENTPDGGVIMNYDTKEEGFLYWSDQNIRFSYLETVARKYVNLFHCTNIYIERECNKVYDEKSEFDINTESDDNIDNDENSIGDTISQGDIFEAEEENCGPFAKLKTYNSGNSNQKNTKPTVHLNGCKFVKKGKMCDFSILNKENSQDDISEKEKLTFDMFKDMFFSNKNSKENKI